MIEAIEFWDNVLTRWIYGGAWVPLPPTPPYTWWLGLELGIEFQARHDLTIFDLDWS